MRWLYALITGAVALQPLHTPSRRLRQLHVTGSEDDLRDEIARRNAARADLGPSFTIYDDTDQIAIMKEAMEEMGQEGLRERVVALRHRAQNADVASGLAPIASERA